MLKRAIRWDRPLVWVAVAVLVAAGLVSGSGPASAAITCPPGTVYSAAAGECIISLVRPDAPAPPQGADGGSWSSSGSRKPVCVYAGQVVPCRQPWGVWNSNYGCYLGPEVPTPPFSDPIWQGHTDGGVYDCFGTNGIQQVARVWFAAPPAAPPDPEAVARLALAQMPLHAIRIGIAPKPSSQGIPLIGVPVYLWVDNPDASTYGPIRRVATLDGVTVTAVGHVERIAWNMGDGKVVNCANRGRPYLPSYGLTASDLCGHKYVRSSADQPGHKYQVSATSFWEVEWTDGTNTGWFRFGFTSRTPFPVGEAQGLMQGPS